jgi:hypothetical protein
MAIDPASTDRDISAKTSRTAICIWAVDASWNCVLLWRKVGYFDPIRWMGYVFEGARKFSGSVSRCIVEAAAMQKVLAPILQKEALLQDFPLYFKPVPAGGDKDARIRMKLQPLLAKGKIYAVWGEDIELKQELKVFPQSKWRKDLLDASEKALSDANPPPDEDEEIRLRESERRDERFVSNLTGY